MEKWAVWSINHPFVRKHRFQSQARSVLMNTAGMNSSLHLPSTNNPRALLCSSPLDVANSSDSRNYRRRVDGPGTSLASTQRDKESKEQEYRTMQDKVDSRPVSSPHSLASVLPQLGVASCTVDISAQQSWAGLAGIGSCRRERVGEGHHGEPESCFAPEDEPLILLQDRSLPQVLLPAS